MLSWIRKKLFVPRYSRGLDRMVQKDGWTAVYVGDYESIPTWVYTTGIEETLGAPELIIFDIPDASANTLLWEAYAAIKDGSLRLVDGLQWPDAEPESHPSVWREVHSMHLESEHGWFTFAHVRRTGQAWGSAPFRAFQLVLSDQDGKLPWEADYDARLRERQPALWEPSDRPALAAPRIV